LNSTSSKPGCLTSIWNFLLGKSSEPTFGGIDIQSDNEPLPYRLRDDFLSPAEHSFYSVIKNLMGNHLTICPKVGLADIFFVTRPNENYSAYNRINRKHVDFLICDPKTLHPKFGIELDDASHQREDREERDEFVDAVFEAANLPLIHIPVKRSYDTTELGFIFRKTLQFQEEKTSIGEKLILGAPVNEESSIENDVALQTPDCPKCGIPMVVRIAKNTTSPGRAFYGCQNFPRCRQILAIEKEIP